VLPRVSERGGKKFIAIPPEAGYPISEEVVPEVGPRR
jgi:hypothetical protein